MAAIKTKIKTYAIIIINSSNENDDDFHFFFLLILCILIGNIRKRVFIRYKVT